MTASSCCRRTSDAVRDLASSPFVAARVTAWPLHRWGQASTLRHQVLQQHKATAYRSIGSAMADYELQPTEGRIKGREQ